MSAVWLLLAGVQLFALLVNHEGRERILPVQAQADCVWVEGILVCLDKPPSEPPTKGDPGGILKNPPDPQIGSPGADAIIKMDPALSLPEKQILQSINPF